jgi:branched-chain amino acid transport system ATP-binding protein
MWTRVLEVRDLVTRYGAVEALRSVSLDVAEGEMVTLIGGNGAGKSTLLKTIAGLVMPTSGHIVLEGQEVGGRPPEALLRAGVALVPERRRVFAELTVRDNLVLGAYSLRHTDAFRDRLAGRLDEMYALFPVLRERGTQLAGTLSGGEQQMLAIGRALMSAPRLLMCDEPSLGLAPLVTAEIMRLLARLRRDGTTVLLVEQNARAALKIADRAYVLDTGEVTLSGPAADLLDNQAVKAAYLGG